MGLKKKICIKLPIYQTVFSYKCPILQMGKLRPSRRWDLREVTQPGNSRAGTFL